METRRTGTGEVHTHLSSQPDKGIGNSGKFHLDGSSHLGHDAMGEVDDEVSGMGDRLREMASQTQQQTGDLMDRARQGAESMRDRAEDMVSQARSRAAGLLEQAENALESRTGIVSKARENPMGALGLAVAVGFLLAGSGDENPEGSAAKAKNQIKGAIMGGISAAISQQLRSMIEEQGGLGNLLAGLSAQRRGFDDPQARLDLGEEAL